LPTYLLSMSERRVVVRNYEGLMTTYTQPTDYRPHDATTCPYCRSRLDEGAQEGVSGLLAGHAPIIAPEQWHAVHRRRVGERSELELGSCFGDNGRGQLELEPDLHEGARVIAEPVEISSSGSNGRGS